MVEKEIRTKYASCRPDELVEADAMLARMAVEATNGSYVPYSGFRVGCAVLLANGETVVGCNQENAAFSVTICAERTALFAAGARFPGVPVVALAVAARNADGLLASPVTPCGTCRQAMVETEVRSGQRLRIILYGSESVSIFYGIEGLLPLSFTDGQMK